MNSAEFEKYMTDAFVNPAMRQFDKTILPRLRESYAASGALFSSRGANAETNALMDLQTSLAAQRANAVYQNYQLNSQLGQQASMFNSQQNFAAQQGNLNTWLNQQNLAAQLSNTAADRQLQAIGMSQSADYAAVDRIAALTGQSWMSAYQPQSTNWGALGMGVAGAGVGATVGGPMGAYMGGSLGLTAGGFIK